MACRQAKQMTAHGLRFLLSSSAAAAAGAVLLLALAAPASAAKLDEMSLERWSKLREAERYQLNIAEKYYRDGNWKVAQAEYEKFLRLYERSAAAPYAQLKWSLCLRPQRLQNTAIKEGFQSVIDYWPDAPEAVAAAYYIGETYRSIGDMKKAKQAFAKVLSDYPDTLVSVLTRVELCQVARTEKDDKRLMALLKELTFDVKRDKENARYCRDAAHLLAAHHLSAGNVTEGKKALETNYPEKDEKGNAVPGLEGYVAAHCVGPYNYYMSYLGRNFDVHVNRGNCPVRQLVSKAETKELGLRMADNVIAYLKQRMPTEIKGEEPAAVENRKRARQYWYYIADAHDAAMRFADVPKTYAAMEQVFGVDDEMLGRLAGWWIGQQKYDQAAATYRRFKDKIAGQANIAYMLREYQKQYETAATMYRNLAVQDTENLGQWLSNEATCYDHRHARKLEQCIAVYQRLIKEDVEKAGDWQWAIATTYHNFGQYKQAIVTYRLTDRFPQSYTQMAECHRALKQWNEAVLLYRQIEGSHPASADWAAYMAADTYRRAGTKPGAIKSYQLVCDKYPKSGYAAQSHAILQSEYKINYIGGGGKQGVEK